MSDDFYRSKKWRKFVKVLREARKQNGLVICEHCQKPILNEYDIIAHHINELNRFNINDASVALNPENIALVHHKCHNQIHEKTGYHKPQVYMVYGAPCSGKSTYVYGVSHEGDLIIDIDRIWQCLSGMSEHVKPSRIKAVVFSVYNHLIDQAKMRNGAWKNCYIVGGFKNSIEREKLADTLNARLILIDTPKEECVRRLYDKPQGRNKKEWERYIDEWFKLNPSYPSEN
ncbi:MAG: AAA family ATPase [Acutalibacteraceae bacterium]|nr:AAA family ATPase [Acutalibacteraceae bacterium]